MGSTTSFGGPVSGRTVHDLWTDGCYDSNAMTRMQTAFDDASTKLGIDRATHPDDADALARMVMNLADDASSPEPAMLSDHAVTLVKASRLLIRQRLHLRPRR